MTGEKKGSDWMSFNVNLSRQAEVTVSELSFPNFEVTDKGQNIGYKIDPELGRIVLDLSPGEHQIFLKFANTPIRSISNYVSLFSWLILIIFLSRPVWNKLISKK
jgi:hypothetical protein